MWVFLTASILAAPNVVFLSVDTLRADHLGCYGYERNTSPNLDGLAAESLVFDDCVCEVPITNPSFGAMFTSLFPRMTGTTRNGLPMGKHVATVPEQFLAAGYHTFCVQSNWTLKSKLCRLDRGFEIYDDGFRKRRWGFFKAERYADEVTRRAIELLEQRDPNRPFFCWIHYSDPHAPYRFRRKYNPAGKPPWKLDTIGKTRARYDSEVAFTDHYIGVLLKALPAENTFLLFVADHGESLYEHDYLGHGRRIYQTCLRVPFMIHGPGIEPGRSAAPVRGIDIGPTLLGLADLAIPSEMLGLDLLATMPPATRIRVVETYGGAVPHLPGVRAMLGGRPAMRQGVLWNGWKLILGGAKPELFNLHDDPDELDSLAAAMPEKVAELKEIIQEWDSRTPRGTAVEADLSPEDVEALRAGGYL